MLAKGVAFLLDIMANAPSIHDLFSASDSDVAIESVDGVQFHLHRKNLESHTGAFPSAEFETKDMVTHLTEPANVLEIVFQFIYPKRHPRLKEQDFNLVIQVAEAVEKYEVFSAMHTCETRLEYFIETHPIEVLIHAIKHDTPDLINQASLLLGLQPSMPILDKLAESLTVYYVLAWIRYTEAWNAIFKNLIAIVNTKEISSTCHPGGSAICNNCRNALVTWITELQADKKRVKNLQDGLLSPVFSGQSNLSNAFCQYCRNSCSKHLADLANTGLTYIKNMSKFTEFIGRH